MVCVVFQAIIFYCFTDPMKFPFVVRELLNFSVALFLLKPEIAHYSQASN